MNVSATLNVLRLLWNPQLCLPQLRISQFSDLKIPLKPEIKAIVLDKDNCFAKNHDDKVWPDYIETWNTLRKHYPGAHLLIVSNSAGTNDDKNHIQADILEKLTGVQVLKHSTKKPGCHTEIMDHFYAHKIVSGPQEVAVIGDRLFTDILMANMMGSHGIWVSEGVKRSETLICKFERSLYKYLSP